MALLTAANTHFTQSGGKPNLIPCPSGAKVTVISQGATLYYKSTSDVTSASSDGTIASGASTTFTSPQYVITATGASTEVFVSNDDTFTEDLRIGDDLTTPNSPAQETGAPVISQPATIFSDGGPPATATSGTDTAFADGTLFLTSVFVPANFTATGAGFLVGSVGGTDKVIVNVWTSAGVHVIGSTVAASGTTAGTAAQNQEINFTAATSLVGPARYFIGVSANGLTAKLRTRPAYTGGKAFAGSVAQTHAATTTVTPPSAFAADKSAFLYLY